ncbi:hypothetical protein CR513_44104, partial [Mucuna pruriens]
MDKVKAIRDMPTPKTETKKNQKVEWNQECQEAFEKVKQYLESPLVLVPAVPNKPLILYLTVLKESIRAP